MSFQEHLRAELTNIRRALGLNRAERDQVWAEVAAARGGIFHPEVRRLIAWKPPRIDVTIDDVAVHVDLHVVSSGKSQQTYTRFRCHHLLPASVDFKVYPDGLIGSIGTALGFEDVLLGGDERFDALFVVRASDQETCRRVWTPKAKRLMRNGMPKGTIIDRNGLITLTLLNVVYTRGPLEVGVDLLAELGGYGREWLAELRKLPGAQWYPPTGPWDERTIPAVQLVHRGVPVWVYPQSTAYGPATIVMTELARELATFELDIDASGRPVTQPPEGLFGPSTSAQLHQMAPARLYSDSRRLMTLLPGYPPPNRIEAAVELTASLCLGSSDRGTYR